MRISRFLQAAVAVACVGGWTLCEGAETVGSGKVASETRTVSGFHGVRLGCAGEMTIVQGDKEELVVTAEDNILPLIESSVTSEGILRIDIKGGSVSTTKPLVFKLTAKKMDVLAVPGSGSINAEKLAADHETFSLFGSGEIVVGNVQAGKVSVVIEGSGRLKVGGGGATNQEVKVSGSGSYDAGGLKSEDAKVAVTGSGQCKLWVEKTLEAVLTGSGEVAYYGNAQVRRSVSGSGQVRSLGAKGQ